MDGIHVNELHHHLIMFNVGVRDICDANHVLLGVLISLLATL
jgi:hypothetical protein